MGEAENEDALESEQQSTETETEVESESQTEGGPGEGGSSEGEDEDVVQIGEEEPPASEEKQVAPEWVKDLRARYRQLAKENETLKAQRGGGQPAHTAAPTLPAKPTLADHEYDEEKYQAAMEGWYAKKREIDAFEVTQQAAVAERQKAVQAVHENYATSKKALKVKDFQDAEDEVTTQFSQVQQSIVIAGAANPGALVYALGKNPKKLQELASIKDPVKFAVAVGKLETEVKVIKRTSSKPAPETPVRGNSSAPASTATLERLQKEAERTGDRTKVAAYLRNQRTAGK